MNCDKLIKSYRRAAGIKEYDATHFEVLATIRQQRFNSNLLKSIKKAAMALAISEVQYLRQINFNRDFIDIGKYRIEILEDGSLWLSNEHGEGMGFNESKLENCLDKFFKANF